MEAAVEALLVEIVVPAVPGGAAEADGTSAGAAGQFRSLAIRTASPAAIWPLISEMRKSISASISSVGSKSAGLSRSAAYVRKRRRNSSTRPEASVTPAACRCPPNLVNRSGIASSAWSR